MPADKIDPPPCACHDVPMRWCKDKRRKSGGTWRCRIDQLEYNKRYRLKNLEKYREGQRRRYAAKPEKQREISRKRREADPEKAREYVLRWKAAHPERARELESRWHKENRERCNEAKQRYDARKRSLPSEKIDPLVVFERDEGWCGICGDAIDLQLQRPDVMSFSLDHVIPVSRGGAHLYSNVQASHLRCNLRKGAASPPDKENV